MNASRLYVLAQIGLLLLALASVATMVYGGYVGTPILPDDVLMFITLSSVLLNTMIMLKNDSDMDPKLRRALIVLMWLVLGANCVWLF